MGARSTWNAGSGSQSVTPGGVIVDAGAMLAMRPRDLLLFARMHLEDGQAADGTRLKAMAFPIGKSDLPELVKPSAPVLQGKSGDDAEENYDLEEYVE